MYAVQQPFNTAAFSDVMGTPAWKTMRSWFLVAKNDQVIPPDAERLFAKCMGANTVELASSHVAKGLASRTPRRGSSCHVGLRDVAGRAAQRQALNRHEGLYVERARTLDEIA
jgi:hypothetical protein